MRLYLIGGGAIRLGETKKINGKLIKRTKNPKILIAHWTTKNKKKLAVYRKFFPEYFKKFGVKKIEFAEYNDNYSKIKRKIHNSNLIYLPGGNPKILIKTIKSKKTISLFKKFSGAIFGSSAGALALCKKYLVLRGQNHEKTTHLEEGLGLTDVIVTVHYGGKIKRLSGISPEKDIKAMSIKIKGKVYAIGEGSALIINKKRISIFGDVYLFNNGKKEKLKNGA